VLIHLITLVASAPAPVWPRQFLFNFTETYTSHASVALPGFMALDLDYQGGSESFYRSDGYYDHICSPSLPNYHGPCWQIATGGFRYILHPEVGQCCKCCNDASGCGALIEAWVDNAVYAGQKTVNGVVCDHWTITGFEANNLMQSADGKQTMCLLDNSGSDIFTTVPGSYILGKPPASFFAVPSNCTKPCGTSVPHCQANPDLIITESVTRTKLTLGPDIIPLPPTPDSSPLSSSDISRAKTRRPRNEYIGSSMTHASSILNQHLLSSSEYNNITLRSCDSFTLEELNAIQEKIYSMKEDKLDDIYQEKQDPRRIRFNNEEEKQQMWEKQMTVGKQEEQVNEMLRDGRCREIVMWYVHHLSQSAKESFKALDIPLPLLPEVSHDTVPKDASDDLTWAYHQYQAMATCQQCHL